MIPILEEAIIDLISSAIFECVGNIDKDIYRKVLSLSHPNEKFKKYYISHDDWMEMFSDLLSKLEARSGS